MTCKSVTDDNAMLGYLKTLILILITSCAFSQHCFAVSDHNKPNSHVFYPDIVTNLMNRDYGNIKRYIMCQTVIITPSKFDNNLAEHYEPQFRNILIDMMNVTPFSVFMDKKKLTQFEETARRAMNKVAQSQLNEALVTKVIIRKIIIE